jgi:hypothetical protein
MSEIKRAQAICNLCPVRMYCLEWGLTRHEEFGVWGGTTPRQRAKWWLRFEGASVGQSYVVDSEEPSI